MSKPETLFHGRLNKRLPVEVKAEKMNNPYRGGTADFWYSGYKDDLWVEYKWLTHAPVRSVKVGLSKLQELWLNDGWKKGRNVCVITGSPQGCAILLEGAWMHNVDRAAFKYTEQDVVTWLIGQVHDAPAATRPSNTSYKYGVQDTDDVYVDSGSEY